MKYHLIHIAMPHCHHSVHSSGGRDAWRIADGFDVLALNFLKDAACSFSYRNALSALQMLRNLPLSMLKG